jgi:DNA-binding CsgD family transcriptional regulator
MSCAVATCTHAAHTRGYCRPHYQRLWRGGSPVVPPSRLLDHVLVDRAVSGQPAGRLTVAEKEAAVRRMDRLGVPSSEIAARLGFASRNSVGALRRRGRARTGVAR